MVDTFSLSFRDRRTQDLCPEEATLCSLDDLLIYRLRRMVHDHGTSLIINLSIHSSVADKINNPLFSLIL